MTEEERLATMTEDAYTEGPYEVHRHDNPGGEINWQVQAGELFFSSSDLDGPRCRPGTAGVPVPPSIPRAERWPLFTPNKLDNL